LKILVSAYNYSSPNGGGRISLKTLVERLKVNHDVFFLDAITPDKDFVESDGKTKTWRMLNRKIRLPQELYSVANEFRGSKVLDKYCEEIDPDILLMQGPKIICSYDKPQVLFVRDFNFGDWPSYSTMVGKVLNFFPAKYRNHKLSEYTLIIGNSRFMLEQVKKYNINTDYVYPFINFVDDLPYRDNSKSQYIGLINPTQIKGIECFIEIAKKLPDRQFLVAGSCEHKHKESLGKLSNVKLLSWVNEVQQFYDELRLLLVPSVCRESFGRIVVEAARMSVPSIASNIGGLPEAVGEGGLLIDNYLNSNEWVEAIISLDNIKLYTEKSKCAHLHSKKFTMDLSLKKLNHIFIDRFGIDLGLSEES